MFAVKLISNKKKQIMEVKITNENFKEYRNGDLPLVVDLWAPWCGPCRMVGPVIAIRNYLFNK